MKGTNLYVTDSGEYRRPAESELSTIQHTGMPWLAILHMVVALLGAVVIIALWNPVDIHEAVPWIFVVMVLGCISSGLWYGKRWAYFLALIIHWPMAVLAAFAIPVCLIVLIFAPANGIAVAHVFAVYCISIAVLLLTFSIVSIRILSPWFAVHRREPINGR